MHRWIFIAATCVACSSGSGSTSPDASLSDASSLDSAAPIEDSSSCPLGRACPTTCCDEGALCVSDNAGNKLCAVTCTANSECPSSSPCCQVFLAEFGGAIAFESACMPTQIGQQCRCASANADCTTPSTLGCCAPLTDDAGAPIQPYICKSNDGKAYDCCNGSSACAAGLCCTDVRVSDGGPEIISAVCAQPCQSASNCGSGVLESCVPTTGGSGACASANVCLP
jgi:hypothetical protein